MRKTVLAALAAAFLCSSAALADPVRISDADEGYNRLARWEQHLDDTIADALRRNRLDPRRAWRLQKQLDSVEARVLQNYYESENGIDPQAFRTFAHQLRDIGTQIGDTDWGARNVYGDGWYDDRDPGWSGGSGWNNGDRGYDNPPGNYYREGDYERSCHQGNAVAGTIFGAIAGGLIGGAASHGNGGAVAGGVILGGLLGNALTRDVDCDDQRYAFDAYGRSLNGDIGREYDWRHGANYGTFRSVREYQDGGMMCRDFSVVTYRNGQRYERYGTACRDNSGNWNTR